MNRKILQFLKSENGQHLLTAIRDHPGTELQKISQFRKLHPPEFVSAAIELLDIRYRAKHKFSRHNEMWFTRTGYEQSSGDVAANWRASRFPNDVPVSDLCCGIGGDSMALALRGPVLAVDNDDVVIACANENLKIIGDHGLCVRGDVLKTKSATAYLVVDPSRRKGTRRAKSGDQYQPSLSACVEIARPARGGVIKVSPAILDSDLRSIDSRVEFVSVDGECREGNLWFGDIGPKAETSATILPNHVTVSRDHSSEQMGISPIRDWILEPDPALIRANLLAETSELIGGACLLDYSVAYMTTYQFKPSSLVTGYRVLDVVPFHSKKIIECLKSLGRSASVVKKRGIEVDPIELRKQLRRCEGEPSVIVVTRVEGKPLVIVCEPPVQSNRSSGSITEESIFEE